MTQSPASSALGRFRVLDLSRARAGPTCVRILADFGADVIRIEAPPGVDPNEGMIGSGHASGDYQNLNRNKRSLFLNLKKPDGIEVFKRLVTRTDVVIENWRPDVKTRLGLDYDALRRINRRLILASISGFGQDGPYAARPGFDQIIQGMAGLMSVTGLPGQGPVRAGIAVADSSAGLYTAIGILTALLEREVSGEGQWLHCSLLHSLIAMMDFQVARYLNDAEIPEQAGNDHPMVSPMGLFAAADGPFNIGVSGEGNWQRLCIALNRPEWLEMEAFKSGKRRVENRAQLADLMSALFKTNTVGHWVELLNRAGVPSGPVYTVPQVFDDPQVKHSRTTVPVETPHGKTVILVTQPVTLERTPPTIDTCAPVPGEHTDLVLAEAGYEPHEVAHLRERGVI